MVRLAAPVPEVLRSLAAHNVLGGYDLGDEYPELGDALLVCATEMRTEAEIGEFAGKLAAMADIYCNDAFSAVQIALALAKRLKRKPRELAGELAAGLEFDREVVDSVEIAGPGFINFRIARPHQVELLMDVWRPDGALETIKTGGDKRINVEFISANPTGPLHVGHGRGAIVGDSVASILTASGYDVHREYYINDAGRQIRLLGQSVSARYMNALDIVEEFPEDGYHGEYIKDIAQNIIDESEKEINELEQQEQEQQQDERRWPTQQEQQQDQQQQDQQSGSESSSDAEQDKQQASESPAGDGVADEDDRIRQQQAGQRGLEGLERRNLERRRRPKTFAQRKEGQCGHPAQFSQILGAKMKKIKKC